MFLGCWWANQNPRGSLTSRLWQWRCYAEPFWWRPDRSSRVKLFISYSSFQCSPRVMVIRSWARIHCCKYKRLKWGPSGEWMVLAWAIGLRSLDVGKEVEEELLPFGNKRSQLRWFRYLMRMPPGLIPSEVFWRHRITCPTCHGSTAVPTEGSIARQRET